MTDNNSANEWELQPPDDDASMPDAMGVPDIDSARVENIGGSDAPDFNDAVDFNNPLETQTFEVGDPSAKSGSTSSTESGSTSSTLMQPWDESVDYAGQHPGQYSGNYVGQYQGNGPTSMHTGSWGAPIGDNEQTTKRSKGWLWALTGALCTLVLLVGAGLLYILKIDREVNGSDTAAAKSTSTVTETAASPASTTTKTSKSNSASATGGCSPSDFPSSSGNLVVVECTGQWALVGPPHTDGLSTMHWENGKWVQKKEDGNSTSGMGGPCFTSDYIRQSGMPSSFVERVGCGSEPAESSTSTATSTQSADESSGFISSVSTSRGTVSASRPACDGRTIVIVQSVIGGNNSTTRDELAGALGQDGDLEFAPPGQCPSLRGSYNGSDVYPVYFDMGSDQQAACSAKRQWGGNVRTLNSEGDFSDPC